MDKTSDRLRTSGCEFTMPEIMVEPQRSVERTGIGSIRFPCTLESLQIVFALVTFAVRQQ